MSARISHRRLLEPRTLAEALRMLRDEGPLVPLAGCTDLYVSLNFGTLSATRFLNIWGLDEIARIRAHGETLSIGARATYTDIIGSPLVAKRLPMLAAAAREVGGRQIQHRGTIGGNVANASPAGDTLPVLAAADATVVLQSARDTRRVPITAFYSGYRQTVARPDELIVAIEIGNVDRRQWFCKVGTRAAQSISKVVMAGVAGDRPRLAVGSVAPTVVRLAAAEAALGRRAPVAEVQRLALEAIAPIDDLRSTAEYRRRVVANLIARFWNETQRTVK